jgi:hypothetical protein
LALKRRETSGCRRLAFRQLRRPQAQERHELGRAVERIGDWIAAIKRKRGPDDAAEFGDQQPAGGQPRGIELRERPETTCVRRLGEAKRDVGGELFSHRNHLTNIAGL